MARAQIIPQEMIQRIEQLNVRITNWESIPDESMKIQNGKSWSGVEIIKHMIIAQDAYTTKITSTLDSLEQGSKKIKRISAGRIPSFLIKRFPPKDGKVKFKMKTTKQFKPLLSADEINKTDVNQLKNQLRDSLSMLKSWINEAENKNVLRTKFNSAIGPMVKFNVLEACEFILCHNERHFHQLEKSLT